MYLGCLEEEHAELVLQGVQGGEAGGDGGDRGAGGDVIDTGIEFVLKLKLQFTIGRREC